MLPTVSSASPFDSDDLVRIGMPVRAGADRRSRVETGQIPETAGGLQPHGVFPRCTVTVKLAAKAPCPSAPDDALAVRILARSFYKELRSNGYTPKHLLALSTELIELITLDLRKAEADAA